MRPWDVASGRAVVSKHDGRSSAALLGGTGGMLQPHTEQDYKKG